MLDHVRVEPDVLFAAAAEFDALAARLQATLTSATSALNVAPSGSEEVSLLAAGYFNRLAGSFGPAAARGIEELVAAAAMLRAQAIAYQDQDHAFGASLATGM